MRRMAKKGINAKTKTKPKRKAKRKASVASRPTAGARSVRRVLERLESSFDVARHRMTDVAVVIDAIGAAAIEARLHAMARAAVAENLARDLVLVRARLDSGGLIDPIEFRSLLLLIDAMLAWLREHVGLEPELSVGQVLDLRPAALDRFEMSTAAASMPGSVVRVRIDQPGWRRGRAALAKPRATLLE